VTTHPPGPADGGENGQVARRPGPGAWPPDGKTRFASLLSARPGVSGTRDRDEDRSFAADLNLDQVVAAVAGDREQRDFITSVLSAPLRDAGTVRYRQDVFRDLEDPALSGEAKRFAASMSEVRAHLAQLEKMSYTYQREGWLLDAAAIYCDAVLALARHLASAPPRSDALRALGKYLAAYGASAGFTALAGDARDRKAALARIRYTTRIRGGRVDVSRYQGEADYSGQVLATFERFQQGAVKDYLIKYRTWPGTNHVTAQITELVARLFPAEFTALDEFCARHADFLDDGIRRADQELRFYLAFADFIKPVRDAGLSFCYPEVSATSKQISAAGTFDLALASKLAAAGGPVVTNDFHLDGPERIIVVTGPNQGGKTTFARTFGQLHYLAAIGCPVPGTSARLFLPDRIFTHFAREEDLTRLTGKLEDDLLRIGQILREATGDSVVIMNETFASTTLHDARFLGTKLITKLMRLGAVGVYVTFVDELAGLGEQVVSMMSTVVPGTPAERTFKVVRKPADGLAYALAIAEKYDLTYERLRRRLAP
jgi:DNA mismatch repair protein MutS